MHFYSSLLFIVVAWLPASLAQTIQDSNVRRSRSQLNLKTMVPDIVRVPVVLDGESIELTASASMTSDERRAYVISWAADRGILDAAAIEQLCAALEAAASVASSNSDATTKDKSIPDAVAQTNDKKAMLAAAYEELKQKLQPMESDFVDLRIGPSTIPGAGDGIFATRDIPEGAVVCEMRGFYVNYEDFHLIPEVLLDRFVTNTRGVLVEQGVCSLINDCYNTSLKRTTTTPLDGVAQPSFVERECRTGLHWNSYLTGGPDDSPKRFVVASERILAGSEIFCDYGSGYWEWN